jgi:hypothetical protein
VSKNPINLAVRFLLEMSALTSLAIWGWGQGEGILRFALAIGAPSVAGALWGVFNVPADRPSGTAVVTVPGVVRLLLELAVFGCAVSALYVAGLRSWGRALGVVTLLHYVVSYDRVWWLIRH